ncbi:hypothetical protein PBY51_010343 [Eleginops maclovinus]|uniref:Uncharacterized protein n=1 Tax=Eleginops maclovinus TaxID=56733 RepID=A0AAN7XAH7_ELEMC|nr:hypothetical protein PBY51_010343 [Eleginops maclovinus]
MGCSPSKGNSFGVLGPMKKGRMLPPAPQESPRDSRFDDAKKHYSTGSTDVDTKERKAAGQTQNAGAKTKEVGSPKTSRRQWMDEERSPRRPQTTAPTRKVVLKKTPVSKERRSQSAESLRSKGPRPFIRRSHSDRRPSLNQPRSPGISVAETCGSEPSLYSQGLDDEPSRYEELWGSQSNLRTTIRSASHPDLCVVGQALHID